MDFVKIFASRLRCPRNPLAGQLHVLIFLKRRFTNFAGILQLRLELFKILQGLCMGREFQVPRGGAVGGRFCCRSRVERAKPAPRPCERRAAALF